VRRLDDPFNLDTWVAGMGFSKGMENNGVGIKASSNSLIRSFSMTFSASTPPIESSRASTVVR
jgi:hypothetical protein